MQSKKVKLFDRISLIILVLSVLVSIFFFIPFTPITIEASKGFLVAIGTGLSLAFWLIARLGEGRVRIPKERLLFIGLMIPVIFFLSSLFSHSLYNSLLGAGFEVGTSGSMLVLFLIFFLSVVHFQTEKRLWYFIGGIFASAVVLLVFEILNIFFGLGHAFPRFFQGVSSGNLVGDWNNFISFVGLVVLLLTFTIEFLKNKRKVIVYFEYLMLFVSLFFLAVVNIPLIWILVAIFSVIIFVYRLATQNTKVNIENEERKEKTKFPFVALTVVLISFMFIIGGNLMGGFLSRYISIPNVDVRPTISTTTQVAFKSLKQNLFLGTGPNTFTSDWALWQPKQISKTVFWNVNFSNGYSFLSTILVTTGILGFLFLLFFIIILFIRGIQSLRVALQNPLANYFILTTFIIAIYSWVMIIIYNPNIVIMILAFTSSGMLIAILAHKKVIPVKTLTFLDDPRKSFFAILGLMFLMIASLSLVFVYTMRFTSIVYFSESLNNNTTTVKGLSNAERMLLNAIRLNKNDTYYRGLSQLYVNRIGLLINDKKISKDNLKSNLQQLVTLTGQAANAAIKQNPKNYSNYLNLGNIYGYFSLLKVPNSYEDAVKAYDQASKLAPNNPSIILARAQLEYTNKNNNEAEKFAEQALSLKPNYTDAYFLLAQMKVAEKDTSGAIKEVETAATMNPTSSSIFFQLGMLRYNNSDYSGAVSAFEQSVILKPTYLEARYYLALAYQKVGRNSDALTQFNILKKVLPKNKDIQKALNKLSSQPSSSSDSSSAQSKSKK